MENERKNREKDEEKVGVIPVSEIKGSDSDSPFIDQMASESSKSDADEDKGIENDKKPNK